MHFYPKDETRCAGWSVFVHPRSGAALILGRCCTAAKGCRSPRSGSGLSLWAGWRALRWVSGVQLLWEAGSGAGSRGRENRAFPVLLAPCTCRGHRHSLCRHEISVSHSNSSGFTENKQSPCSQIFDPEELDVRGTGHFYSVQGTIPALPLVHM